jgi:hypothetical protein
VFGGFVRKRRAVEENRVVNKTLQWFAVIWGGLALLPNIFAIVGLFIGAGSFWAGWWRVTEIYSPFNVINWLAELAMLSPPSARSIGFRDGKAAKRPLFVKDSGADNVSSGKSLPQPPLGGDPCRKLRPCHGAGC